MKIINDERFAPLIAKKVLEELDVPEMESRSNIMSFLKFGGIESVPMQALDMLAGTTLQVYVSYMSRKYAESEKIFDNLNEERFAFELMQILMKKLKSISKDQYYNVILMLEGEYPEDVSKEMMDDLVKGTLFHLNK